jgi:hypothetical protein
MGLNKEWIDQHPVMQSLRKEAKITAKRLNWAEKNRSRDGIQSDQKSHN